MKASKIIMLLLSVAVNAAVYFATDARQPYFSTAQNGISADSQEAPAYNADSAPFEKKIPSRYNKRFFSEFLVSSGFTFQDIYRPNFSAPIIGEPEDFFSSAFLPKDLSRGPPAAA